MSCFDLLLITSQTPEKTRRAARACVPLKTARPTSTRTETEINKDELREIIWHERRVELAMEGWRRDDLMRQHRFGEVMCAYANKYNVQKGRNFDDERDYLLPIPQGERDKSNNILTQNPKY